MLSVVEQEEQICEIHRLLSAAESGLSERAEVWAKIETRKGVDNLDSIARVADGIVLGRGDLLIDTGYLDYYECERRVRDLLVGRTIPLMLGTQLWTASAVSWLPHRSELSYLCEWIAGGVDSILLSDETTVGTDPVRTIANIYALTQRYAAS